MCSNSEDVIQTARTNSTSELLKMLSVIPLSSFNVDIRSLRF